MIVYIDGNAYFRRSVQDQLELYLALRTPMERTKVQWKIIDNIHARGGRFLRKHQVDASVRIFFLLLCIINLRKRKKNAFKRHLTIVLSNV
jgi:hypothetical protein